MELSAQTQDLFLIETSIRTMAEYGEKKKQQPKLMSILQRIKLGSE